MAKYHVTSGDIDHDFDAESGMAAMVVAVKQFTSRDGRVTLGRIMIAAIEGGYPGDDLIAATEVVLEKAGLMAVAKGGDQ